MNVNWYPEGAELSAISNKQPCLQNKIRKLCQHMRQLERNLQITMSVQPSYGYSMGHELLLLHLTKMRTSMQAH